MFPTDFNTSSQAGPERGAAESHPPTIDLQVSPSLLLLPHGQCSSRQASAFHCCCHRRDSVRGLNPSLLLSPQGQCSEPQPFAIVVTAGTVFGASTLHYCCHRRDSVRDFSPSLLLSPVDRSQPFTTVVTAGAMFGSTGFSPSLLLSPQVASLLYCCHRRSLPFTIVLTAGRFPLLLLSPQVASPVSYTHLTLPTRSTV